MSDPVLASYILLWVIVAGLLVVSLGTARQVALLTKRFPPDVVREPGPKLGSAIERVSARTLAGEEVSLGGAFPRTTVLAFFEDGCKTCQEVWPFVRELVDEPATDVVVLFEREPGEQFRDGAPILVAPDAFRKWKISRVPYACVVDEGGKVEAKGHLAGELGRLRQTLGLGRSPSAKAAEVESNEPADSDEPEYTFAEAERGVRPQ
jgi:methylamine dehydrogenase accessory protein MauD